MSHARIEEVSDSDPSEGNISDVSSEFDEREILKARAPPTSRPANPQASQINPSSIPSTANTGVGTQFQNTEDDSKYKDFQCLYPIYFDKNRSRQEGRRVGLENAVENPLAREIVNACSRLRLETLFEPAKCHPKDWANPGRVKIKLKGGGNSMIKNKHHLYTLVSEHLQANPTTTQTATLVRVPGVPPPALDKEYPKPAVPKGWKMGTILPYYSSALTGGGVSENFFKDMMAEMQQGGGGLPPGMENMAALQSIMGGGAGPSGGGSAGAIEGGKAAKKEKKKKVKG